MDLRKMNLIARGKLPVFEFLDEDQKRVYKSDHNAKSFRFSSFDEVICLDDAESGYPAVLIIDYDGRTNGRIVQSSTGPEFVPMSDMTDPSADVPKRKKIMDYKIRATAERNIPYLILPVLSHQRLTDMKEEFLVARFAVIRGLLQSMDLGLISDANIITGTRTYSSDTLEIREQTYQQRRKLIVPFWDRWEFVSGRIEQIHMENRGEDSPNYEISIQVQYLETPGPHPNWEEQFNHLTTRTLGITKRQVESRANITEETLEKETGYGSRWPTLVFQCGPPESEIYVEFQLDGFQTNLDTGSEELMYEPYLGLLASMIIEAGLLGIPVDDSNRVWKPNSLEKFKESSDS